MTTPPTASPLPSNSPAPLRMSGPKVTVATSRTSTGVPVCAFTMITVLPMSSRERIYPRPRTMYSRPVNVSSFVEDDVDIGIAEVGESTDILDLGQSQQC